MHSEHNSLRSMVLGLVALTLASCGGGGGGSSPSPPVPPPETSNSAPVGSISISGSLTEGQTLTANTSNLTDADGLGSFNYQWRRNDTDIDGATSAAYTLVSADVGTNINVTVSWTDSNGTVETVFSTNVGPVVNNTSCSVSVSSTPPTPIWPGQSWETATPQSQGICPDSINEALDYAFATGNDAGAVLVIKNGYIVAERYSSGKSATDLVTSWSVAKSFTSALIGAALDDGFINDLDQSLADFIPSWADTEKADITLRHLLTVRTALRILDDDDGDGVPDGGEFYNSPDQLAVSLARPLDGTPGEQIYIYSNSDVMIAGEIVQASTGMPADDYLAERLGNIIGFSGEWWTDSTDHVMSYCCLDAEPRDFARFGLLYARGGDWNGTRLLSHTWYEESTEPALNDTYGYYWWPLDNDGYAALGVMGQMIAVFPEDDLVVLRFGNYTRMGDGSTVRQGNNYHQTSEPANYARNTFLDTIQAALDTTSINNAPVANAGVDQTVISEAEVTLFGGQSSDADGDSLTYLWELSTSPEGNSAVINGSGSVVTFVAGSPGTYSINLIVNDGIDDSTADTVVVEVIGPRSLLTDGTAGGAWPNYAGNLSSNKYLPLSEINENNIDDLEVLWRWRSPDNDIAGVENTLFESTPLMIDGVLYTSTSFSQVSAINAATGSTLWVYDPEAYNFGTPPNNGFLHRGLAYAEHNGKRQLYMVTGDARLIAINPVSGQPIEAFGSLGNGIVDLLEDIPRLNANAVSLSEAHDEPGIPDIGGVRIQVGNTSPPIMCRNVVIVGSSIHDGELIPPSPPGDVWGYDATSGELKWTFHIIPREGEFGTDTWENESWRDIGGANVWAPMSVDEELGHVYLPTSCPTNNYYGGDRPGNNLFGNSIVSLDCETGERNWHFQTVHHDIWDYDLPAAPNIVDIVVDEEPIKALAQVSKQGFVYVLDRVTGEPVWPIIETPVPSVSTVPGEWTAPTQPIPSKPPPFAHQGVVESDLVDPGSVSGLVYGPLFTPPSTQGTILMPGIGGGANWGGASFDPTTQMLYVTSLGPLAFLITMEPGNGGSFYYASPSVFRGPNTTSPFGGRESSVTAYDLNEGVIQWQVANASSEQVTGMGSSLVTDTLLFTTNRSLDTLSAFNKTTGELLRSIPVGGRISGAPMGYELDGKQYLVVALGVEDELMELVALAIP